MTGSCECQAVAHDVLFFVCRRVFRIYYTFILSNSPPKQSPQEPPTNPDVWFIALSWASSVIYRLFLSLDPIDQLFSSWQEVDGSRVLLLSLHRQTTANDETSMSENVPYQELISPSKTATCMIYTTPIPNPYTPTTTTISKTRVPLSLLLLLPMSPPSPPPSVRPTTRWFWRRRGSMTKSRKDSRPNVCANIKLSF